jgi:hypothetical protein
MVQYSLKLQQSHIAQVPNVVQIELGVLYQVYTREYLRSKFLAMFHRHVLQVLDD